MPGGLSALLLLFVLTVSPGAPAAGASGVTLVEKGQDPLPVVVAPDSSATVRHAARELSGYLGRVSGADFAVVTDVPSDRPAIRLRVSRDSDLGEEAYRIRTAAGGLEIVGGGDRGVLYGAYDVLERYAGVRWYAPDYTRVPSRPTLSLPPLDVRRAPRFGYREVFFREADDPAYSAHNRLNGRSGQRLTKARGERPGEFTPLRRLRIFNLVPPDRYRGDHPEYYGGGQLRFADPAVQRIAADAARDFLSRWRERGHRYLVIEPADRGTYYHEGRDGRLIERYESPSAAYVDFVRAIAEAVGEAYPDVTVLALAYGWSREPPRGMDLPENMGVMFAPIARDHGRRLDAEANRAARRDLIGWNGLTHHIVYWGYQTDFAGYLQPYPNLDTLDGDASVLDAAAGVEGWFAQGAYNTVGAEFSNLRAWVLAHLMWDPARKAQTLIDDFLQGYFGDAAPWVREYIRLLNASAAAAGERLGTKVPPSAAYLDTDTLRQAEALFDRAARAVADDPARKRHVRSARMAVDYAVLASPEVPDGAWVNRRARLQRLESSMKAVGMSAYREGRGHPPKELLAALSIDRQRPTVPEVCRGKPATSCRRAQDLAFDLAGGARIVADTAASDGAAARQDGDRRAWGIQLPLDRLLPAQGDWRVYLQVRVEGGDEGTLLKSGVYPGRHRSVQREALGADDGYALVALPGTWQADASRYVWVAPKADAGIDAVYVDRIVAVREDGS
jgi:hypothetical protein